MTSRSKPPLDVMLRGNRHGDGDAERKRRAALRRLLQERDEELMRRLELREELRRAFIDAQRLFREVRRGPWE